MSDANYRETMEIANAELEELLGEEEKAEEALGVIRLRIDALRKTVATLAALLGEDREPASVGITDAVRAALKAKPETAFSARGVRTQLQANNFPIGDYKNVLAVIHTTLKRLVEQGEIQVVNKDGKIYYKWGKGFSF